MWRDAVNKYVPITYLIACLCAACPLERTLNAAQTLHYPHLEENALIHERMRSIISPYLLPLDHPMKPVLDHLFSQTRVTENMQSLVDAGFEVIAAMPRSYVVVVRHPAVPGYLLKLYLDSETRMKEGVPNWLWLTQRCIGASKIREIIHQKAIKHFFVPDKWIYVLPIHPLSSESSPQPLLVIASDVEPFSDTKKDWKTVVTKEHLNELFVIMKRGYSTIQVANIPYTKSGKFAFMDTEYPCRSLNLEHVSKYLSPEMAKCWKRIVAKNGD
jgi:hypothetical protein